LPWMLSDCQNLNRLTGNRGCLHSSHWLASSLKLASRCPVSGCWPSCFHMLAHCHRSVNSRNLGKFWWPLSEKFYAKMRKKCEMCKTSNPKWGPILSEQKPFLRSLKFGQYDLIPWITCWQELALSAIVAVYGWGFIQNLCCQWNSWQSAVVLAVYSLAAQIND